MHMYFNNCRYLKIFLTYTFNLSKDIPFFNNSRECKREKKVYLEHNVQ